MWRRKRLWVDWSVPADQVVKLGDMHSGVDVEGVILPKTGLEADRLNLGHVTEQSRQGVAVTVVTSSADRNSMWIRVVSSYPLRTS